MCDGNHGVIDLDRLFVEQACCCGCAPLRPTEKGREHLRRLTGEAP
jgi:hypothetical protein